MNMAEAKAKMMEIADGKYHTIEYRIDDHGNGRVNQLCKVYLEGQSHYEGAHWESAIAQLEAAMSGAPTISEDIPCSQPIPPTPRAA
jgi:hypothetical protein